MVQITYHPLRCDCVQSMIIIIPFLVSMLFYVVSQVTEMVAWLMILLRLTTFCAIALHECNGVELQIL